jgi:hypothetical protein
MISTPELNKQNARRIFPAGIQNQLNHLLTQQRLLQK